MISSVSETAESNGIRVQSSSLIEVRNNTVLRIVDGTEFNRGILIDIATDVTIVGNRILNPAGTGTVGIFDFAASTGVNCIDNIIAGYTTSVSGCDFVSGNLP